MSIRTSPWPAGVPCWVDLSVPDVAVARAFYADVLGWTFEETGEDFGGYVVAQGRGAAAAGIGPLPQDGVPPAWTVYLASDDADATAAAVEEDLRSSDPDAARTFYRSVFGYRTEPLTDAGPDYATFALPDEEAPLGGIGGMMGMTGAPSHWAVYFGVSDAAAAVAAAHRGGGRLLHRDFDTPYGRIAGLVDPADAVFWVIEVGDGPQPDRAG